VQSVLLFLIKCGTNAYAEIYFPTQALKISFSALLLIKIYSVVLRDRPGLSVWLFGLRREGQARTMIVGHLERRERAGALRRQLDSINFSLEGFHRAAKKTAPQNHTIRIDPDAEVRDQCGESVRLRRIIPPCSSWYRLLT